MAKTVRLWLPPADEHSEWQSLTGDSMNRAEYESAVANSGAEARSRGMHVETMTFSVAHMRDELLARGLENSTANRAKIIADPYRDPPRRILGVHIANPGSDPSLANCGAIGFALIEEATEIIRAGEHGSVTEAIDAVQRMRPRKKLQ